MKEKDYKSAPGIPALLVATMILIGAIALLAYNISHGAKEIGVLCLVLGITIALFVSAGLYKVEPNKSAVLSLFGKYIGTTKTQGLHWNNPFFTKKKISLRVRNFESGRLKVNDEGGSPIEIASIIVWEVVDSSEAVFNVDDYESFVQIQSEAAIRSMASIYPYDPHEENEIALRSHPVEVSERMKTEIQARLAEAGINVIEARISHLAYAPEITQAMLQRQQAGAIIAARQRIVEGAVGMVEMALSSLKEKALSILMTNAALLWSAIFWSYSVLTVRRNPWSIRDQFIR